MARTCIICGNPANSREHVFPAALGGRRTNKGIYCDGHNNGYSSLAGILAKQLNLINTLLGVRGDHAEEPHAAILTDEASGLDVRLSAGRPEFASPRIEMASSQEGVQSFQGSFSSDQQLQDWLKSMRAQGFDVQTGNRAEKQYHLSGSGVQLQFGGADGLRAIGYVAQTFLAHHFPDFARTNAIDQFKNYTLGNSEDPCVWWDYEPPISLPSNSFSFGHRIIVGLDSVNIVAYARVSLFSVLDFSVLFGTYAGSESKTVIIDIDPLAEHPPRDIVEIHNSIPIATVFAPEEPTEGLRANINSGRGQERLSRLFAAISDRDRNKCANAMLEKISAAAHMNVSERKALFESVVEQESQRVLNLMRHVVGGMKNQPDMEFLVPRFEQLVAADPSQANGLSELATCALQLAKSALVGQMIADYAEGCLDCERMEMLIGGGPGAEVVGKAIAAPVILSFPE